MFIELQNRKTRNGESLFVFGFESQDEFNRFIDFSIDVINEFSTEKDSKELLELIEKAKNRCDDKYADNEVACSFSFFSDEMSAYTICLLSLLQDTLIKYYEMNINARKECLKMTEGCSNAWKECLKMTEECSNAWEECSNAWEECLKIQKEYDALSCGWQTSSRE